MTPMTQRFLSELSRKEWTNQQVAQELGVSERQVTRWRNGQEPRYTAVAEWARVFDRDVSWFYGEFEAAA